MDRIDIIIPTYKNEHLTKRCIRSIMTYTEHPYRIIWVDDGSPTRSAIEVLYCLNRTRVDFKHHCFLENRGPASAINRGLQIAESNIIAILNNDVVVTNGWLTKLVSAISDPEKNIGILSAVTDHASSICKYDRLAKALGLEPIEPIAQFFNSLPEQTRSVVTNISYFCAVIKREVIEKVGYLDEQFYMGGEDDDYNDRVRIAGYETAVCVNCFVYHDHHASFTHVPDIGERRRQNVVLLRQKRAERARVAAL